MRIALLSDVHSNLHALEAVLAHARGQGVEQVYCLGDIVGYNAQPNEVIAMLRKVEARAVMGNHDWAAIAGDAEGFNVFAVAGVDHSRAVLSAENRAWLQELPKERRAVFGSTSIAMYHGSPRDPLLEYVFPFTDQRNLDELAKIAGNPSAIALGHTHLPMRAGKKTQFINPGSVGQPRDGDPRAGYAVLDSDNLNADFHRVRYDVDAAARAVREAGLPDFLWQRLLQGV